MKTNTIQLQKYPAYKDSGVEWLGEIPEHWEILPGLRFIFENKDRNKGMIRNTVLSLSYGNIRVKGENELTGLVPESFETYQFVNKGDLIFRPTDLQNDTVSLRSSISEYEGIITNAYLNLRFTSKANSKFYHYFFRAIDNNKVIYGLGSGLRQNISYLDFRRFLFPFPPLTEQTAIANFLDNKTALIDKAIALKEKQIELLKERRQIVIHRAVTRGLNPDVRLKDSGVEWIGEIPEHWEVKQAKHQIESISNGTTEEQLEIFDESNSNFVPVTRIETISNAEINMNKVGWVKYKKILERYRLKSGDILFSHINSLEMVGKTAIYKGENELFAGMNLLRIRPKQITNADWLHWYLKTSLSRNYFTSVAKPSINQASLPTSFIGRYKIAVPRVDEQKEIVIYIETANTKITTAISLKEKEIEKLKEYKSVLINEAVSGKIKVN